MTDSGKVVFNNFLCRLAGFATSPCQSGSPGVLHYPAGNAAGTDYQGNGAFKATRSSNSTGVNAGVGAQYAALSAAQRLDFPGPGTATPTLQHGPRGITVTQAGVTWYADSEAAAPLGGPPGALGRLDANMVPLSGAGFTGVWADRDKPGVVFYHTGVAEDSTGKVWTDSEVSDRFVGFNPDGTPAGSVLLDLPGPPIQYRNPYSVAIDKADDSFYVPLVDFRDNPVAGASPFLEKRDKNGVVIGKFTAPNLPKNQVVFSAFVDPVTRHVFAWTESNTGSPAAPAFLEWDKDGNLIDTFGVADVPELANVRGMAVDKNGYRYVTVNQGSNITRVMILAKTPEPVTSVCPLRSEDGASVKLSWQCTGPDAENSTTATQDDYGQAPVLDYVVEQREVGTAAWTVTPHAASTDKTRSITGLDPAKKYEFRVSAWNEAGNGDWAAATAVTAAATDDSITAAYGETASVDVLANDSFDPAATADQVTLLDANGDPATSYSITDQGTYSLNGTEVTFTPEPGFSGKADPARYRVTLDTDCFVEATITATIAAPGTLTLRKQVDGDPGAAAPSAWTLTANGPGSTTISGTTGDDEITRRTVAPGEYTLSEDGPSTGYSTEGFVCTTNGSATAPAATKVTVNAGDSVDCVVTNTYKAPITTAQLTLKKSVTGDAGAADASAFTLSAERDGSTISGTTGAPAVTNATVQPGSYTLAESGPTKGYTALGYSCAINDAPAQQVGYTVELTAGDAAECTITNVYTTPPVEPTAGKLTLVKQLAGDAGTNEVSAWTLTATGDKDTITGTTGNDTVTAAEVEAGQYALTETGPTQGYTTNGYVCTTDGGDAAPAAGTVTIKANSAVVCVITNTYKAPPVEPTTGKLTLTKKVAGDPGAAQASAWTLTATGDKDTITGATATDSVTAAEVEAGKYTLKESGPTKGYTTNGYVCTTDGGDAAPAADTVTIKADSVVVCVITNTYTSQEVEPPTGTLTLIKKVSGDPGAAQASAWTLTATGDKDTITGTTGSKAVSSATVAIGTYTLTESGPTKGYSTAGFVCTADDGEAAPAAGTVTVKANSAVVCVVTNSYKAPVTPTNPTEPTEPTPSPTDPTVTPTTDHPTPTHSTDPTPAPTTPTATPLPDTGFNVAWLIPVAAGLILLAVLLLVLARRRSRRQH